MSETRKVIVCGSGPAGYTAAIYAARANLEPLMIVGKTFGGQLMTTSEVENFPGYPTGVTGPKLMEDLHAQAERFGMEYVVEDVVKIDTKTQPFTLTTSDEKEYKAHSVIIATGAQALWLNLEGENKLRKNGCVSSCAVCDGYFHKDEELIVVGGGDSMCEEAIFLTKFAKKVTIIHRRKEFRASKIMLDRARNNEKITFMTPYEVKKWNTKSDGTLDSCVLSDGSTIKCDACFLAIGHKPSTEFLKGTVTLDKNGYILCEERTMTSVPGIFAAGDCVDKIYRQAITASADGARAALDAEEWLSSRQI